ncbi:zinc ribbon domain-containing protein [Actinomycetospora chlora]
MPGAPAGRPAAVPPAMWAAIGTSALAAVLALVGALTTSVGYGGLGLIMVLLSGVLAVPVVYAVIAVGLYRGSRVARCAGFVAGPVLLVAVPAAGLGSAALVLAAVLGVVAPFPAALSAGARGFIDGPWGAPTPQAPSVVVARLVLAVVAALTALGALIGLVGGLLTLTSTAVAASSASSAGGELGDAVGGLIGLFGGAIGVFAIVSGLVSAGMALLGFWLRSALGARNRGARVATTVVAGLVSLVVLVGLLAGGIGGAGSLLLGVNLALIVLLWVPSDARQHFGDVPLPLVEHLRGQVVHAVAQVGTPVRAPVPGPFGPPRPAGPVGAPVGASTGAPWPGPTRPVPSPDGSAVTVGLSTGALSAHRAPTVVPSGRHPRPELACPRCGVPAAPGGAFCGHCGGRLTAA